jgi:hypothetical protein
VGAAREAYGLGYSPSSLPHFPIGINGFTVATLGGGLCDGRLPQPPRGAEDSHCGCVDYIGGVAGGEARVQRTTDVWASKMMQRVVGVGG